MTKTTAIRVRYELDESGKWYAEAVEEPRCHTQGRSILQARDRIREAIGLWFDEPYVIIDDLDASSSA